MEFRLFLVPEQDFERRLNVLAAEGWDVVACWPRRSRSLLGFWMQGDPMLSVLCRREGEPPPPEAPN